MDTYVALRRFVQGFMGRATSASEVAVGACFDARMRSSLELAGAGEPGIAFENLCSNLHEYEVPISAREYDALFEVARRLSVPDERWAFIEELRV